MAAKCRAAMIPLLSMRGLWALWPEVPHHQAMGSPGSGGGGGHAGGGARSDPGTSGSGHGSHTWHGLGAGGSHTSWLGGPARLGSDLSWGEEPLGLRHGWHEVSSHSHLLHTSHSLHPHAGHPLDVLAGQMGLPVLLPLGQSHVQRLGHDDASVHLSHGLGGFLRRREANESKALGASLLAHNLGGGDGSIGSKLLPETFIIDGIIQVLDVQIDSLISVESLKLQLFKLLLELSLSLSLLLSSAHVESLATDLGSIEFIDSLLRRLRVFE